MKCKDVERCIIDAEPGKAQKAEVEAHLAECPKCRRFAENTGRIRTYLGDLPPVEPPATLVARTLTQCLDYLAVAQNKASFPVMVPEKEPFEIPRLMWAALTMLVPLTLIFLMSIATTAATGEPISYPAAVALLLILQNGLMLLCAPIILKRRQLPVTRIINGSPDLS